MAEIKTIFSGDSSGLQAHISKAQTGIAGLTSKLGRLMAGGMAVGYVKSLIDAQSAVKDTADALGVSTRMLQGMREIGRDVGVPFEKIQTALSKIEAARMESLRDKTGKATEAFQALGLSGDKLAKMNTEQTVMAMAEAYAKSGKGAAELSAMVELLGVKNMALLPVFDQLGTEAEKAFSRMEEAGRIASEKTISDMDKLGDKLGAIFSTLGNWISKALSGGVEAVERTATLVGGLSGGGVQGMVAAVQARESEPGLEEDRKRSVQAAILESQQKLYETASKESQKLSIANAQSALRNFGLSDALLRIGGGASPVGAVQDKQLSVLNSIDGSLKVIAAKDTAPRLR